MTLCCLTEEGALPRNMVFHPSLATKQDVLSSQTQIHAHFTRRLVRCRTAYIWLAKLNSVEVKSKAEMAAIVALLAMPCGPESLSAPDQTALIRTHLRRSCTVTIAPSRGFSLSFARCVYLTKRSSGRQAVCLGSAVSCPSFFH